MNNYEQFKNSFLVELENTIPDLALDYINRVSQALDRAAYPYEISVKEYLNTRSDDCEYLFTTIRRPYKQLTKSDVEKIVGDIADRTSITKKVTPHVLRHTSATQAINNGMLIEDISKFLGHSSVATTMIYAKISEENIHSQHTKHLI